MLSDTGVFYVQGSDQNDFVVRFLGYLFDIKQHLGHSGYTHFLRAQLPLANTALRRSLMQICCSEIVSPPAPPGSVNVSLISPDFELRFSEHSN